MKIRFDANIWQKMVELVEQDNPQKGTVILEKHLIDDGQGLHWVEDVMGSKLLGRTELTSPIHTQMSRIHPKHVKAAGFDSKEALKRSFANYLGYQLAREVNSITVAQMGVAKVERYWCPKCSSVSLTFSTNNIIATPTAYQLPFICNRCGIEFYTLGKERVYSRITFNSLAEEYPSGNLRGEIPPDQQAVLAIVGEKWFEI